MSARIRIPNWESRVDIDRNSDGLHRIHRRANSGIGLEISAEARESSGREGSWDVSR